MANKAKGSSVPASTDAATDTNNETALEKKTLADLESSVNGDVSGPLHLAISDAARDVLIQKFQEKIHRVKTGFDALTKPGDIHKQGQPFWVVNALTIDDYLDKRKGELLTKHVFQLEFEDDRVVNIMQGDAGPRREL